jgi:hypothetical protein
MDTSHSTNIEKMKHLYTLCETRDLLNVKLSQLGEDTQSCKSVLEDLDKITREIQELTASEENLSDYTNKVNPSFFFPTFLP